jgi:hypothetical protein
MKIYDFTATCETCKTRFEVKCESGTGLSVGAFVPEERVDCPNAGCPGKLRFGDLPGKLISIFPVPAENRWWYRLQDRGARSRNHSPAN